MKYTHLGRTGLTVSRLCLGTMNFGARTSETDSFAIMDQALESGINFFDTANSYGSRGGTEQIIGRWLCQDGHRRDHVVLATKVYGKMGDGPNEQKISALNIRRACEDSLRRLQTDHIDLYQMHHIDRECPWEETWQAMEQLVREGKILYVGSSNFAGWHIATANQEASKRNFLGLVSEQTRYSLVTREPELEVIPACEHYGLGLIPYSPLGGGLLGGGLQPNLPDHARRRRKAMQQTVDRHRNQLEAWESLCKNVGHPPGDVALAWLAANPVVTAPIIGPRTMEQLQDSVRASDVLLDDATLNQLDEIWPGPGGPAPEAYAW